MVAVFTSAALLLGALAAAGALTWRRHATQTAPVEREVEGPTCYPRVKR